MYGFILAALSSHVRNEYGEETWKSIACECGLEEDVVISHQKIYEDQLVQRVFISAAEIVGLRTNDFLEKFGGNFYDYCVNGGYERIMRVLGNNLADFLCNLDALHDHLASVYTQMNAPSFRCCSKEDGSLYLYCSSDRQWMYPMVKGLLVRLADQLFDTNVHVDLVETDPEDDQVVFSVKERTRESRRRSCSLITITTKRLRTSNLPEESCVPIDVFCRLFPFHFVLNRKLEIVQAGVALLRILNCRKSLRLQDVFQIIRPIGKPTFTSLLANLHHVFVLKGKRTDIRLKGQVIYASESDSLLFLCSPRVDNLDDLKASGLFLSDIPPHDATRDLILITQARRAERELVEKLEEASANLKRLQRKLEEEKRQTDQLLISLLPSNVASKLRLNQTVEAEKYNLVTILFSDIVGFTAMCSNEKVVPMDIIRVLNKLYTKFDMMSTAHNVYKVETIGDAYVVVAGLPHYTQTHADRVVNMALSMQQITQSIKRPASDSPIQIRIGIHSGDCLAGIVGQKMPRYCLFGHSVSIASQMEGASLPGCINISKTAKSYLTCPNSYIFEENWQADDCYFVYQKSGVNFVTSYLADLSIPEAPRSHFKTPSPSPTASPDSTPVRTIDYNIGNMTNSKVSTPMKMPIIHISDVGEVEEDTRRRREIEEKERIEWDRIDNIELDKREGILEPSPTPSNGSSTPTSSFASRRMSAVEKRSAERCPALAAHELSGKTESRRPSSLWPVNRKSRSSSLFVQSESHPDKRRARSKSTGCADVRIAQLDLKKIRENGRLVFYFYKDKNYKDRSKESN